METKFLILLIISILFIFILFLSLICFYIIFVRSFEINFNRKIDFKLSEYRDNKTLMKKSFSWFDKQKFKKYEIENRDDLKLTAFFLKTGEAKKLAIFFHGWRGSAKNDFSPLIPMYQRLEYNILLVNQRAHGKSQGRIITFGIKEKNDVVEWVKFAEKEFNPSEIILVGVSMGASSILMACDQKINVKAIIADCGYSNPEKEIKYLIKKLKLPIYPTIWFAKFWLKVFTGINLSRHSVTNHIKSSSIPILFIHGTADKMVPKEDSIENYNVKEGNYLLLIENAYHAGSFIRKPLKYESEVKKFLEYKK